MKKIDDHSIHLPPVEYHFSPQQLLSFLNELGVYTELGSPHSQDDVEDVLTVAQKYASYKYKTKRSKKKKSVNEHERLVSPGFSEKIVRVPFLYPNNEYHYLRVRIGPSTIPEAGMGAFALDQIPRGSRDHYRGVIANEKNANAYYSWMISPYNKKTGEEIPGKKMAYIDCEDPNDGNWTRYVNCGPTSKKNNIDVEQHFDKIFYMTLRDILPGEELFVDYGEEYRTENLKMKGKY